MKFSHFISGGLAFWIGEMAEHFAGGMGVAVLVAGCVGVAVNYTWNKIAENA